MNSTTADFDHEPPTVRIPCLGTDHSDAFKQDPGAFGLESYYPSGLDAAILVCRCPECLTPLRVEVVL